MNKKIKEIIEALEFMGKTGDVSSIAVESLKNGLEELDEQLTLTDVVGRSEKLCYEDIESTKCLSCGDESCLDAECLQ